MKVRAEGHVGHQQGAADSAANGARVVQHLLHGDGQSAVITEHGHAQRIADENHVNAGLIYQARSGIVVGGQRSDRLVGLFSIEEGLRCDFRRRDRIFPGGKLDETHLDSPVQLRKKRGCHLIRADSVYV
jgi:hypothetical protein